MDISVIRVHRDFGRWNLVANFLKLRKEVFVDRMQWPLYVSEEMEFEQYDSFACTYIIAHEGSNVLGGARLVRTDAVFDTGGKYSYMIRDAYKGVLSPGLPTDICFEEPPVDKTVWELTRLATFDNIGVGKMLLTATNRYLHSIGANTCLFLGPPAFMRMAKSMGYNPVPLGKICRNIDGSFLAFKCAVVDF